MYLLQKSTFAVILICFLLSLPFNNRIIHIQEAFSEDKSDTKTRIFIFFGTRPEIIKLAPVIETFILSGQFQVRTIFTGQQPDLVKPFFDILNITIDFYFDHMMAKDQSLPILISKIMAMTDKWMTHR